MPSTAPSAVSREQRPNVDIDASKQRAELTVACSPHSVFTTPEEWRLAAGAPAFWKPILGPASRRQQILAPGVNWQRVLFVRSGSDIAGYLQFYLRGAGPHDPRFQDFAAVYRTGEACWRFLVYKMVDYRFQRFEAYAYRVIVKESYRGCGVGRCLMLGWLDLMKAQGVRQVALEVWSDNPRAYEFYRQLGFRVDRRAIVHRALRWLTESYPIKMVYDLR